MRSFIVRITLKISQLAKSGSISSARKLFDEIPQRDTVAWNAMISAYSHLGLHQESLSLFGDMRFSNANPDHFTLTAVLSACAGIKDLLVGRKVHARVAVSGYESLLPVNNALIDMYGKCLSAENASKVFEEMGLRNEVSWCSLLFAHVNSGFLDVAYGVLYDMPRRMIIAWNTVIAGCAKWGEVELCVNLFTKMLEDYCSPDQWTLSALMNACAETSEYQYGCMVHGFIIRSGWGSAVEVNNSILSFYSKSGEEKEVLRAVDQAAGTFNVVSWNSIIDAHMKLGNIKKAYLVFQCVPEKNLISWTSMIAGYTRNGQGESALGLFIELKRSGLHPDDVAFGAVLHACSNLSTLGHGRMIHGCVVQSGFHAHAYVGNGLVNMYAKCGDICNSYRVFNDVLQKDLISWNTMLFAYGLHGCSSRALQLLGEMEASRMKPDKITFIGLLMTCSHLGLIKEGLTLFESMSSVYGISPEIDHVACMVDMLGRGGKLDEARELANEHSGKDTVKINWLVTLFGSYSARGDITMRVAELGERLKILKPRDDMSYVLLSNLYCSSGQWKQAQIVRKAMADQGVKKMPGCSWIEVRNQVTTFVAGRNSFSFMEDVYMMVHILESEIRHPRPIFCWHGVT